MTLSSSDVEGNDAAVRKVVFGVKEEEEDVVSPTTWSCDVRCLGAMIVWVCLVRNLLCCMLFWEQRLMEGGKAVVDSKGRIYLAIGMEEIKMTFGGRHCKSRLSLVCCLTLLRTT